jgi:hypothetical protein
MGSPELNAPSAATAHERGFDSVSGVADVIVVWNALEHFWPYWDLMPIDWMGELDHALAGALEDRSVDDHVVTLQRLSAALPDAHAHTTCVGEADSAKLPFAVDVVEGKVVVTTSRVDSITRGDIIVTLDGKPADEQLTAATHLVSGSPQWKTVGARGRLGVGPRGSSIPLRVRRGTNVLDVTVMRDEQVSAQATRPPIQRLDDGVYYVDLERASMAALDEVMSQLALAPGVVFDLRIYPHANHAILSHLLTSPVTSPDWLKVPHVIRPDHTVGSITSWTSKGLTMPVLEPHISGRVAFLIGPDAASYAESILGFVQDYHLGELVGAPTAGANGNLAEIDDPTGCRTTFTGARVTNHDGSRFHLVGIRPTIPAARTIVGVTAGQDEILERALLYIRTGRK